MTTSHTSSARIALGLAIAATFLLLPTVIFAQGGAATNFLPEGSNQLTGALGAIVTFIQGVLIPFLFAIGFFMFVWGVIKFFVIGGNNDEAKAQGKSLIIYALAGFVIVLVFWGIVNIIASGILSNRDVMIDTPPLPIPGGGS